MTPTDTRKRDALANMHYGQDTGDGVADAVYSFKAGYNAGYAECAGEIERLKEDLKLAHDVLNFDKEHPQTTALREQCEKLKAALEVIASNGSGRGAGWTPAQHARLELAQFAAWEASQKGRAE